MVWKQQSMYGEQAQNIRQGDKFVARVKNVEGRRVIVLESFRTVSVRAEPL